MPTLHPVVRLVRDRIERRSERCRADYLDALPTKPADRTRVGCANLAHTTAVLPAPERKVVALARAPHLGVITAYNDMLSAHHPFADYPEKLRAAARAEGATLQVAGGVPAMCDGVTQGREGMELSLFSRDVIALGTAVGLSHDVFDAAVLLGVCDKIAPGLLLGALGFGHLPTVFVPAGPMASGLSNAEKARVRQQAAQGLATRDALLAAEEAAYHAEGTCTFYGTANSNQLMLDLMGLQFPGGAFVHPRAPEREALLAESVRAIVAAAGKPALAIGRLVDARCIVNALVGLLASGGSTNHAMHWVAVARAAGWLIDWGDLDELSRAVPLIARIYPNGTADVNHFHAAGGTAAFGAWLAEAGLIDGSAPTVWGSTLAETLAEPAVDAQGRFAPKPPPTQSRDDGVLRRPEAPFQGDGGLRLLDGNLGRAIVKVSAVKPEHRVVEAPCRVFDSQLAVVEAFEAGEFSGDVVVVVRHQGPKANGMPELHKLTPVLGVLLDRGQAVALVTDGRMSGASGKVLAAIHVTPEAGDGGALARLRDGDVVRVDGVAGTLSTAADLAGRDDAPAPAAGRSLGRGYFGAFRRSVSGAELGASVLFEG
ncbi:MAG: phosphogluconate dehydratase [Burkholderiales bacterium]|nr:phosphogluconate dehydratase [Burkholderiales bacterium]